MDVFITARKLSYGKVMFSEAFVCPRGGSLSWGVYVQRESLCPGGPCLGGLCLRGLCLGGVGVRVPVTETHFSPRYGERAGGKHPTGMHFC